LAGPEPTGGADRRVAVTGQARGVADAFLRRRDEPHRAEAGLWLLALAVPIALPEHAAFGAQVLIMMLFALSLDFILGYAGVLTLGHAAYFGVGAYVGGLLSARLGWHEPLSGLLAAGVVAGVFGALSGWLLLRYRDLTLLMLTLAVSTTLFELANTWSGLTGGYDGLMGIQMAPVLGLFEWDISGVTGYGYALAVLLLCFLALRRVTVSPFGQALRGIRENTLRMRAIGAPILGHLIVAYSISAVVAGIAGGLFAQTNGFITMDVLGFERSAAVLTVLILGGTGRLYGALFGALVYMLAADWLAKLSPVYWEFGVGLLLVVIVLLCPDGLLGVVDRLRAAFGRRAG
jgi:branched-chain amino acid transport system permease protein